MADSGKLQFDTFASVTLSVKYFIFIFLFLACVRISLAQAGRDSAAHRKDSITKLLPKKKPDSSGASKPDTAPKASTAIKQVIPPSKSPLTKLKADSFANTQRDTALKAAATVKRETPISNLQLKRKVDSTTIAHRHDSLLKAAVLKRVTHPAKLQVPAQSLYMVLHNHPYFNFFGEPMYEVINKRTDTGKEGLFYLLTGVVLYFSLVRLLFGKYVNNLFSVFFRVSLKQKQIREQLLQTPLPSLLLNIFFIISGGIYISFLLRYYNFKGTQNLWYLMLNSTIALGLVYLIKFFVLKVMGWIFNIAEATDTYVFVVFLVNKLLGVLLIPFLVLLAFSDAPLIAVLVTLSLTIVLVFFGYRYIISYTPVRNEIKVSQFHFFLYLCAFEIIPLLLIYKVLLTYLERSS